MAPVSEAYFPSLDKCFSQPLRLLSWKRAFLHLCDPEENPDHARSVHSFLSHPESVHLLSQCLKPFDASFPKSKVEFESRTAAIHVSPPPQAPYNLEEIKADALWLSQNAAIDEVTALRITILEWQDRPATRLLAGFSEEEGISLLDAAGVDNFSASLAGSQVMGALKTTASREEDTSTFSSERSRRLRLRYLYLSEKSHILKISRKLLSIYLRDTIPNGGTESNTYHPIQKEPHGNDSLRDLGSSIFKGKIKGDDYIFFLRDCIDAIKSRLQAFHSDGGWFSTTEADEESEAAWRTVLIEEVIHIMQIIFLQLEASTSIPTADLLISWLGLVSEYGFLESVSIPCLDPVTLLLPLQALVSTVTLAFLKLPLAVPFILGNVQMQVESPAKDTYTRGPYFLSRENIAEINEFFLNALNMGIMTASPAIFAWGMILHTMRELALIAKEEREMEQFHTAVDSFTSNTPAATPSPGPEQSLYEDLLDSARIPAFGDDFVAVLILGAMDKGRAFDVITNIANKVGSMSAIDDGLTNCWLRLALLDVICCSVQSLDYMPEIVEATLAILRDPSGDFTWKCREHDCYPSDPRLLFLKNSGLMDRIFRLARSRFPYETVPFLKLCRALIIKGAETDDGFPVIFDELENIMTFTQVVSPDFQGYETIREDENANFVSLVQPILMIDGVAKNMSSNGGNDNALIVTSASQVPAATTGQVISESKPAVIMWHHQYSCLSFLGSWLESWVDNAGSSTDSGEDSAIEIIELLSDLLASVCSTKIRDDRSSAKKILELASDGLTGQRDIIAIIIDIMERSLHSVGLKAGIRRQSDLTVACVKFSRTLLAVLPSRVWPFLARSSLLGSNGQGGMMSSIVSAVEMTAGEYPFLLNCIRLFDCMVEDAISHAAIRKAANRISSKSNSASDWNSGIPSHIMSNVLLSCVRTMIEVLNSNGNWRFNEPERRLEINCHLASAFEKILYYTYGVNDSEKLESKITGVFAASASYILDVLRPRSSDEIPFNPILRILLDGLQTPTATIYLRQLMFVKRQSISTLRLAIKLVQAAQLLGSSLSLLEDQLFKATPVLVRLYGIHDHYRLPVIKLLELLISKAASDSENEPPSLLGHLGAESSCLFLDMLSQFDKPLGEPSLLLSIWQLLSTLVSKRQQWFAVYLLTGSSPRDSLRKDDAEKAPTMRGTPFLRTALETLINIRQVNPQVALGLLEFVSRSQEHWPWATAEIRKHPNFLSGLINHTASLDMSSQSVLNQVYLNKIAAVTADLCAIYLHSAKEARDRTFFKTLIPLVSWFAQNAVEVSGYNASLHANLKRNFEMKYAPSKLLDFKRTSFEPWPLGDNYYYDMYLAQKLLSYDFAWTGTRNQGFEEEFARANMNLSLVEAQVSLFNSWKFFAIEHCADFMPLREVQRSMALVIQRCLIANTRDIPQEAIFDRLQQSRIDFALALLQRLVEITSRGTEVFEVLSVVWEAIRARGTTYENALIHNDTDYYRSLLNVLFLALQFHVAHASRASPEAVSKKPHISYDLPLVLEVIKIVIAQGFRSLTTYLHDEPEKCSPKDFAILNAILQTALQVKNTERIYERIVFHIADNDTARYAMTLFSVRSAYR